MDHSHPGAGRHSNQIDLGFGGLSTCQGDHIIHFYREDQEMIDVIVPYLAAGLKGNDKCTYFCCPEVGDTVSQRLKDEGVEVEAALSSGQFVVHEGVNSAQAVEEIFSELLADARASGYPLIRHAGDMGWGLRRLPSTQELMQWEATYGLHYVPQFPLLALCQYDLRLFGGEVILDALKTHPLCIVGDLVQENPFHTPPGQFLDELAARPVA